MGSCHSGDHIAEDHIHTDITTCNIEEPQQKYCLRMVRNSLNMFYWIQTSPSASAMVQPKQLLQI